MNKLPACILLLLVAGEISIISCLPDKVVCIARKGLNIRACPDIRCPIIGGCTYGQQTHARKFVVGINGGIWGELPGWGGSGRPGYGFAQYLQRI